MSDEAPSEPFGPINADKPDIKYFTVYLVPF